MAAGIEDQSAGGGGFVGVGGGECDQGPLEGVGAILADAFDEGVKRNPAEAQLLAQVSTGESGFGKQALEGGRINFFEAGEERRELGS